MTANRKRGGDFRGTGAKASSRSGGKRTADVELNNVGELPADLVFEDPYGDEFEEEDVEEVDGDEMEDGEPVEEAVAEAEESGPEDRKAVWRPGVDKVAEGEELDYDPSAYVMYHSFRTEWPCLTFDFLRDNLGDNRQRFPHTMYMVAGSQADRAERNQLTLIGLTDLHKTHVPADSEEDESDNDSDLDEDPTIEHVNIPHAGGVNRVRACPQQAGLVAALSDSSAASIFDLSVPLRAMMSKGPRAMGPSKPLFSFGGHRAEGYALDWSPASSGRLVSGDNLGAVHVWSPSTAGAAGWTVDSSPFKDHTSSVEDLQWSPAEATVFASASSDRTVRIWDTRDRNNSQIAITAHGSDVNVISWNRAVGYLLASGADDGSFKVWDLRALRPSKGPGPAPSPAPLAHFCYHKAAITSIEWAPHDESVLATSSADHGLTVWDLSVEAEAPASTADEAQAQFPAQLLFLHLGQRNIKELHWHPQIPGAVVSTAEDAFNIFKPAISVSA